MSNQPNSPFRTSLVSLLILLCLILGAGAVAKMDIRLLPDRELPEYTIRVSVPGMIPEWMDENVTRKVEEAVRELGGVEKLTSRTRTGAAEVTVKVKAQTGSDYRERLEEQMDELSRRIPGADLQIEPISLNDNLVGYFLLHGSDLQTLSDLARFTVYEKWINLPGVARVETETGSVQQKVELLFRPSMLQAYGVTPGDVINQLKGSPATEQVGIVGEGADQAVFQWVNQAVGPQDVGKKRIATDKGYVPLHVLAEIRDMRGSKGDAVTVYHGEPAIGLRVYAQETGQLPAVRSAVLEAAEELNNAAGETYRIDLFDDRAAVYSGSARDITLLAVIAVTIAALLTGWRLRSVTVGMLLTVSVTLSAALLLGGLWLSGVALSVTSLGPIALFVFLFIGATTAYLHRLVDGGSLSPQRCQWEAIRLLRPLLLTFAVILVGYGVFIYGDFVKQSDKPALLDALPVFIWGTVAMALVNGFITPTLAGNWLTGDRTGSTVQFSGGRAARLITARWERLVSLGYLPFGLTLVVSLLVTFFFRPFLLIDPFLHTGTNQVTLSLPMVQGSTLDEAVRAAKAAEAQLLAVEEVADLYTVAGKDVLVFQLKLKDKYDWTRSRSDLEKEWEKRLGEIPGTDPFALVVGESSGTRMQFTVKGPSLYTTREIANQMVAFLKGLSWRDEDGREIITDETSSADDRRTTIVIRPKADALARHQVSEAEVKRQLASYLGEQPVSNAYWNGQAVSIVAKYPERLLEHPEQVKHIMIRTPAGTVPVSDLVEWSIGAAPAVYEREDGLYVFTVSSAVSDPGRIDGLYAYIPVRMQNSMTIPEGYTILNETERRKLEQEASEETDMPTRVLVIAAGVVAVLFASLLLLRRKRDGAIALALLPALSGAVLLGLLFFDRPLNIWGVYGIAATAAILIQQTLIMLDSLERDAQADATIPERVRAGTSAGVGQLFTLFVSLLAAAMPLALGWPEGIDFHASFAAALLSGTLFGVFAVAVLVPAIYQAAERNQAAYAKASLAEWKQRLRAWWDNTRVRLQDRREWKRAEKRRRREREQSVSASAFQRREELSEEDFLPLRSLSSTTETNR